VYVPTVRIVYRNCYFFFFFFKDAESRIFKGGEVCPYGCSSMRPCVQPRGATHTAAPYIGLSPIGLQRPTRSASGSFPVT
jgi:hypothetical protein